MVPAVLLGLLLGHDNYAYRRIRRLDCNKLQIGHLHHIDRNDQLYFAGLQYQLCGRHDQQN